MDLVNRGLLIMSNWTAPGMSVAEISDFISLRYYEAWDHYEWCLSVGGKWMLLISDQLFYFKETLSFDQCEKQLNNMNSEKSI